MINKEKQSNPGKKFVVIFAIFIITFGLVTLVATFFILTDTNSIEKFEQVKFSSEEWKKGDEKIRGTMVDSLMKSNLLIGKDSTEIKEILGKPAYSDSTHLSYWIDIGHSFGESPWMYSMYIKLDSINHKSIGVWLTD